MQGFNMGRYVPPEHEGVVSSNALHKKHALGARASKSHLGILTVRFEMPFPIWCTSCPKPTIIGQGVRFNAEKKRVGNYHSTPVYSFRLRHAACGGAVEIRTDPKNTAYVVTEGARKRDTGEERVREGDYVVLTEEEREERRRNAFAGLEGKVEEVERAKGARERILDLQAAQEQWEDPYAQNRKLRAVFREGRTQRERDAEVAGRLQDRMSLGIELLPATREDELRAQLVEFGEEKDAGEALRRPLFGGEAEEKKEEEAEKPRGRKRASKLKPLKAEAKAELSRAAFASTLRTNTRAKLDPFLSSVNGSSAGGPSPKLALGIKRKRKRDERGAGGGQEVGAVTASKADDGEDGSQKLEPDRTDVRMGAVGRGLVDYDSD